MHHDTGKTSVPQQLRKKANSSNKTDSNPPITRAKKASGDCLILMLCCNILHSAAMTIFKSQDLHVSICNPTEDIQTFSIRESKTDTCRVVQRCIDNNKSSSSPESLPFHVCLNTKFMLLLSFCLSVFVLETCNK